MIHANFDSLIGQISEGCDKSSDEVRELIKAKIVELQDLISQEGAAHIVANELGVKLAQFAAAPTECKIGEIALGNNNLNVCGKVTNIFEVRSFKTEKREGRVASLIMGDETGKVRVTVWDEKIIAEFPNIKEGDIIKVSNAYSKENNGFKELHLGNKSKIQINPEGVQIEVTSAQQNDDSVTYLKDMQVGEFANVFATIVNVYEPRFYDACPQCNKKVLNNQCQIHGEVKSNKVPILNIVIDDGTETIRASCFREVAEAIINNETLYETIKSNNLGKQFMFRGRKTKNDMYNTEDFMVATVTEINPKELIEKYVS